MNRVSIKMWSLLSRLQEQSWKSPQWAFVCWEPENSGAAQRGQKSNSKRDQGRSTCFKLKAWKLSGEVLIWIHNERWKKVESDVHRHQQKQHLSSRMDFSTAGNYLLLLLVPPTSMLGSPSHGGLPLATPPQTWARSVL